MRKRQVRNKAPAHPGSVNPQGQWVHSNHPPYTKSVSFASSSRLPSGDMHAERDELIKRVFPRLRTLYEEGGVTWSED